MPSQAEIERVRLLLNRLAGQADADLRRILPRVVDRLAMSQLLAEDFTALVERYGAVAAEIGAEQFAQWAAEFGITPRPVVAPGANEDRATARLGWALSTPDQLGNMAVLLNELVKQPFRSTVQDSAWASGLGWARVPAGSETCAFCLMLASRGAVYSSKEMAKYGLKGKKYHGDCDCIPTLVRGPQDYPKGYDPDAMYDAYLLARDKAEATSTPDILSALRAQRGTH